jgi:nucleoside-diphosphate-sugar epimerase
LQDIKARARMEAEAEWMQLHESVGLPVHVFRLGGIYGPGRSVEDAIRRELAAPGAAAEVQVNCVIYRLPIDSGKACYPLKYPSCRVLSPYLK